MYLGVDIGGTKTLVAVFSAEGEIKNSIKFPTPKDYKQFIKDLDENVAKISTVEVLAASVAVPGLLDREAGIVHALGNLPWRDVPIRDDISKKLDDITVIIENDARLAGLAEAVLLHNQYQNVLYLTVSTGIGGALLRNGRIVKELEDTEMGKMPLEFEGTIVNWEDFASGRAMVERYGKLASEIDDAKSWKEIARTIGYGLSVICSVLQPEVVVFGGGAGQHVERFKQPVLDYLKANLHPVVKQPAILATQRKEEAGIYGCYEIVRQYYDRRSA